MTTTTITADTVRAALDDGTICPDGHTIFEPSFYEPHFDVSHLAHTFNLDGTITDSIFRNGVLVKSVQGVFNIDFLSWLHGELGIKDKPTEIVRWFAAEQYVRLIKAWLDNNNMGGI